MLAFLIRWVVPMQWLSQNVEWIFSGVGIAALGWLATIINGRKQTPKEFAGITIHNENHMAPISPTLESESKEERTVQKTLDDYKNETRILFIDDDSRFKVAKILANSGWVHTKLIKDAKSLDDRDIIDATILFIDVQGVGIALGFSDEGLGLAEALKDKYPNKKVIIYSAENQGDRFHKALRKADSFLSKNADPYEFQKIVEEFTIGE
ncbi:DNA-binding transcriptional response regulator [Pseudomonas defluvii]|uniref:hypothetical protein n=1 Tax=Pseudomonas defluvii TaxID=1876757 RepID=UPI003906D321